MSSNLFLLNQPEIFGYSTAISAYNALIEAKVSKKLLNKYVERFHTGIPAPNHFNSQAEVDEYVADVYSSD